MVGRRTRDEGVSVEVVAGLVRRLEPDIVVLFEESEVPLPDALRILEDVVAMLLLRWNEVTFPEAWAMELLGARIRRWRTGQGLAGDLPEPPPA